MAMSRFGCRKALDGTGTTIAKLCKGLQYLLGGTLFILHHCPGNM